MSFLVRVLLLSLAFHFILPLIQGIEVGGGYTVSLGLALLFTVLGYAVTWIATTITALLTLGTFGMALLVLIPVWLLGFWIIPASALMLTAELMPAYLSISGWMPAIWGGLITLIIGIATDAGAHKEAFA